MSAPDPPSAYAQPGQLVRLSSSPSPSTSSLTSDEEAFDHTAPAHTSSPPPALGVRDLLRLRRKDKAAERGRRLAEERRLAAGPVRLYEPDGSKAEHEDGNGDIQGVAAALPFTQEVVIRGWNMVGGRTWTQKAKVGAYVVYEIEITLRSGGKLNILRRYNDFVALRDALETRYPGFFNVIPELPGKAHMRKFDPDFIAERQPRLQRFLRTVLLHPVMGRAGEDSVLGRWILDNSNRPAVPAV